MLSRLEIIEEYIQQQFAQAGIGDASEARDFTVEFEDEEITVALMTDDEPEAIYVCEPGSDDDCFIFTTTDAGYPREVRFPLHPAELD